MEQQMMLFIKLINYITIERERLVKNKTRKMEMKIENHKVHKVKEEGKEQEGRNEIN